MSKTILIGCIADDFTGASDAASFLVKGGLSTILFNGVPKQDLDVDCDAAVIALKTRSCARETAVADSLEAVDWLKAHGTRQFYSKYCSTFDSTPKGNIGPILDAVLEKLGQRCTVLCPALPVNKRTVKDGILYVNGVPLGESPMKNHPLNPMWDSDLAVLMKPQSKYPCIKVSAELMQQGKAAVQKYLEEHMRGQEHYYIIPDYYEDAHAELIAELFGDLTLLSGGSGILTALGIRALGRTEKQRMIPTATSGRGIVIAGSCSVATRGQIEEFRKNGGFLYKMDPLKLIDGTESAETIWAEVGEKDAFLIYSSDTPEEVDRVHAAVGEKASEYLEKTSARLAVLARHAGFNRIIIAGGETSGAVTQALGYNAYWIGESIAAGVPVMAPLEHPDVRLVLKSGNFGQPDFFLRALKMTSGEEL